MLKLWVVTGALRSAAPGTEKLVHRLRGNQGSNLPDLDGLPNRYHNLSVFRSAGG